MQLTKERAPITSWAEGNERLTGQTVSVGIEGDGIRAIRTVVTAEQVGVL